MTDTRSVKEHLRNGALYQPPPEPSPEAEWKDRFLRQYSIGRQLSALLQERTTVLKWFIYIGIPLGCLALVFAAYFGYIHPAEWIGIDLDYENLNIPSVGLREALLFIAIVNGWVLFTRRRIFTL